MDDLISRQKAIMDAESWGVVDEYEKHLQKNVIEWLKEFPPAELGTDTISRQAAIDALQKCRKHCIDPFDSYHIDIQDAENQLSKLPPVQPEPHEGHWINGKCDLCGEHAPFWAMASTYHESNYCPNCGAKMKGGAG